VSHAGAADDEALDEAADAWTHAIAEGDAQAVVEGEAELRELCELT
jgi:hypothetical protein